MALRVTNTFLSYSGEIIAQLLPYISRVLSLCSHIYWIPIRSNLVWNPRQVDWWCFCISYILEEMCQQFTPSYPVSLLMVLYPISAMFRYKILSLTSFDSSLVFPMLVSLESDWLNQQNWSIVSVKVSIMQVTVTGVLNSDDKLIGSAYLVCGTRTVNGCQGIKYLFSSMKY